MLGNNEDDVKVGMGGAQPWQQQQQQQQQAPAAVAYATAQPTAGAPPAQGWGVAQAQPVMATAVPPQQQQPQIVYVQAPPVVVGGRPYVMGGACACGGSGTIVTQQVSGTQILSFVLLLLFFWPLCWLPFCMDQCYTKEIRCARCGGIHSLQEGHC